MSSALGSPSPVVSAGRGPAAGVQSEGGSSAPSAHLGVSAEGAAEWV